MSTDPRYLPEPRKRSLLARLLAVAVLAGVVIVLVLVVNKSLSIDDEGSGSSNGQVEKTGGNDIPKEYAVEDGDSLSSIAEKYGISTKRLERLNPDIDPNTLATGQVIKLH